MDRSAERRWRLRHPSRIGAGPAETGALSRPRESPRAEPGPRSSCPRRGRSSQVKSAPILSARARIPASPRWPSGTRAGSKPLPSSWTRSRTPLATRPTLEADLPRPGVLDDVVEGLLRDPVEGLLDRRAAAARRASHSTTIGSPIRPWSAAAVGPQRADRPSCSRLPGPELEDQRPHLGQRLALEVAQLAELRRGAASGSRSSRSSTERDTRVIEKSAWVTESWSSRARWARSSPAASSPAWRRRSRSSRSRSLTSRAAPCAPMNRPSRGHARAVDLDQDIVAVGVTERQAHAMDGARMAGQPAEPDRRVASGAGREDLGVRPAHQLGRLACRASSGSRR